MILVDTSVWIDHLREGVPELAAALEAQEVLCHPIVIGELAMGSIRGRAPFLRDLARLPRVTVARNAEVLTLVDRARLHGRGLSYPDASLLAAALLTPGTRLWTGDRRLAAAAAELAVGSR